MKKLITIFTFILSSTCFAQNIGIGETSPTGARLQVKNDDSAVLLLHNDPRGVPTNPIKTAIFFKTGDNYAGSIATIGSGTTHRLGLFTNAGPASSSLLERLSVLDNGNVGIGDITPSYKLDVQGSFRATSTAQINGLLSATNGINVFGLVAVNGSITASGSVTASGSGTFNNLTVNGPAQIGGVLSANTISSVGNTTVGATLSVIGQSDFNTIKITGGSPGVNKILGSANNNGNVVWLNSPIGSGFSAYAEYAMLPKYQDLIIPFSTNGAGTYNEEGSFDNTSRRFVAPAAGVYHFDVNLQFILGYGNLYGDYFPDNDGYVTISARINGNKSNIYQAREYIAQGNNNEVLQPGFGNLNLSFNLKMAANEFIDFLVNQGLAETTPTSTKNMRIRSYLQGYRVY